MRLRLNHSFAAFLEPSCELHQRQRDGVTDRLQLEHIYSSLALFVLANTRLRHPEYFGKVGLSQFRLDSNTAKQPEEYLSIALPLGR
jgi:hypothetical protein